MQLSVRLETTNILAIYLWLFMKANYYFENKILGFFQKLFNKAF